MGKIKYDMYVGQKIGLLKISKIVPPKADKKGVCRRRVEAVCECGRVVEKLFDSIVRQKSCGCLRKKHLIENPPQKTHGLTKHPLYRRWQDMKKRCVGGNISPRSRNYEHYAGKGIRVCGEWLSNFMSFYNWSITNGFSRELILDRIENSKGYSPENCRWVTYAQSNRNTSKNIMVEGVCLKDYCEIHNIRYKTIYARIKYYGYSIREALELGTKKV